MTERPKGLIPPVLTPLDEEGRVDRGSLKRHLKRLLEGGASGVFVLGSAGEGPYLPEEEKVRAVETAREACEGRAFVVAGALEPSTGRALSLIRELAKAGAQYAVAIMPYYIVPKPHEIERHFLTLADHSPIPLVLYNLPSATQISIPVELVADLAGHENVASMKDSSGDLSLFQDYLDAAGGRISLLMGVDELGAAALLLGADGLIVATGNITPRLWARMIEAARSGKAGEVRELNRQARQVRKLCHLDCSPVGALKEALRQLNIFPTAKTCPPNSEPSKEDRLRVTEILRELKPVLDAEPAPGTGETLPATNSPQGGRDDSGRP